MVRKMAGFGVKLAEEERNRRRSWAVVKDFEYGNLEEVEALVDAVVDKG